MRRLCEGSVYNIFALKCGVCSIAAFTVNLRLSAVASLAVYSGCGAVHVAFPGRFLTLKERTRKSSVPRVFLKTEQNFRSV